MITKITNGKVLVNGAFSDTDVYFRDNKIISIGDSIPYDVCIDAEGNYVTAGFVDLHCHGGGGADFTDGTVEAVRTATLTHLKCGTTTLFPTVLSADTSVLEKALDTIDSVRKTLPSLADTHIEGPYFSPSQTGAQNPDALRTPQKSEYDKFLKKYKIARWDYAPEMDKDYEFLNALLEAGVTPSAAHTDADADTMLNAAERGCRLVTHLYSCTSTIRREKGFRIAGVLEATYLSDDIAAELIADGCHLPNTLLRLAYKQKGPDMLVLVTDGMRAAGTDTQGECNIGGVPCFIEDGVAKLRDRSAFAGSIATADRLLRTVVNAGIPLADGVKMMTETPARIMGLRNKGKIEVGMDADIVIFNADINIKHILLQGEFVV